MGKKSNHSRPAKTGQRTIKRRNHRHRYSPKPSTPKTKRRSWPLSDTPPTAREIQRGAETLLALLLMGARRNSTPWIGHEYWKAW